MNKLREVRQSKGLNQRQLAEKAHVCQSTVSEFERQVRKPWPEAMKRISKVLDMPSSEIFPGEKIISERRWTMGDKLVYSCKEVGDLLGLSRNSVYAACLSGSIPCLRISKRILIPKSKLEDMINAAGVKGA